MRSILYIILIFSSITGSSQNEVLVPYLVNNQYGFATEDGKLVVQPQFQFTYPFFKNYTLNAALKDNKAVIINRNGKVVLKGAPDNFQVSQAITKQQFLSEASEIIASKKYCQLDSCADFDIIEVCEAGRLFDKMNGLYFVSKGGKVFLADEKGKQKSPLFDAIKHIDYGELEYCITEDHQNKKFGLLDDKGNELLTCIYDAINYQGKGVFSVRQGNLKNEFKVKTKTYNSNISNKLEKEKYKIQRKNNHSGIVDSAGNIVTDYIFDKLYPLNNDRFIFWKGKETGIMDYKGNYVFHYQSDKEYSEIKDHAEFSAYVPFGKNTVFFNRNKKWILIDLNGQQTGPDYDGLSIDFQFITGIKAGISLGNKIGVIDERGKYLLKPVYDQIYCLREDNSYIVKTGNKWTWLSTEGKDIYKDFDDFRYLTENYLLIHKESQWFYVSSKGLVFKEK